MQVCQIMTGGGGWPLTIFMTPDKKPFFAGTYIPKEERFGRTGLLDLLPKIKELWGNRREDLLASAKQITLALKDQFENRDPSGKKLDDSTLKLAYNQLLRRFDTEYGGFGGAPKFPSPHQLMFLMRYWNRIGERRAVNMVEKTLDEMSRGGIYDQIGGGFHRYSTDARWLLPHFEKMLYDQAMLAIAYIEAYQMTGKDAYAKIAGEIFDYVLRDMTSPEGGFYSAEDADSEGEEGKFYVWTIDELKEVLEKEDAELIIDMFNVREDGNFVEPGSDGSKNTNILHMTQPLDLLAEKHGMDTGEFSERLGSLRQKLFSHREARVHPHKDDKVLVDWNGLMIAALARGSAVLNEKKYLDAAEKAADFILMNMRGQNDRLLHRFRDGEAAITGHTDDYAFFIWGLIELYEATFEKKYLEQAMDHNDLLMNHYWDKNGGGFFLAADDAEELLIRHKEIYDGAMPSGNSVALLNLLRLSKLSGDSSLENLASIASKAFAGDISTTPSGYTMFTNGLDLALGPAHEVVIRGEPDDPVTRDMLRSLRTNFIPNIVVHLNPEQSSSLFSFELKGAEQSEGTRVYVCSNYTCKEPTADVERMLKLLGHRKL
jgi:uncharacterized protein YyaL (SSP411 family)